jgi:hypothetical protein
MNSVFDVLWVSVVMFRMWDWQADGYVDSYGDGHLHVGVVLYVLTVSKRGNPLFSRDSDRLAVSDVGFGARSAAFFTGAGSSSKPRPPAFANGRGHRRLD